MGKVERVEEKKVSGKRPDSNRTSKAKMIAISRRQVRSQYSRNGGRY